MSGSLDGAFSLFVIFDASVVKWLLRSLGCCFMRVCCVVNMRFTVLRTSFGFFNDTAFRRKFPADLVTFTEEILNGKLHFLCSASCSNNAS